MIDYFDHVHVVTGARAAGRLRLDKEELGREVATEGTSSMIERQWRRVALGGAAVAGLAALLAVVPAQAQQQQQQRQPPAQQQRQPAPAPQQQPAQPAAERVQVVNIDQALLERWLVLFGDLAPKLGNAQTQNLSEQQIDAIVAQSCQAAGLTDVNLCRSLDAYMNALLTGADEQGRRFVDPGQRLRADLQQVQNDRQLTPQQKQEARQEIEGLLAQLPERIPPQHIQLLTRNATRIFALLARVQPPDQQGQQGAPPPAQGRGQGAPQGAPPPPQQGQPRR